MRTSQRRGAAILLAASALLAFASTPVTALTLQRTWSAKLGTNGSAGTVALKAYTNGVGSIRYSLKGLKISATYSVQIRYGTCAHLGSIAARLTAVHTSPTRTVSRLDSLTSGTMHWIWQAARRTSFVVRIVSGTSVRCGNFTFTHATRVSVSGLGIDLPVIRGPSGYPPCRVGMYLASVAQPREPGVTFIYAHARTGMFLPLLTSWRNNRGASLIGRTIKVWTSDNRVSYYRVTRVRTATNAMTGATSLTRERLWLQTSTGPNRTYAKLIVEAARYATYRTTYSAAHPPAHPISC